MKALFKALQLENKIYPIEGETLTDCIRIAWLDKKYSFYQNSELIDVNNRFRIFEYENSQYIIKKSSVQDGEEELRLASKAEKILQNIKINNYDLEVIVPTVKIIDGYAYIITNYKGVSLQESLYSSNEKIKLKIEDIFAILDEFMTRGVLYRGFLPRNTILKDKKIYLLDWEDVIFCKKDEVIVNQLWATNFLLNWSYFFDKNDLEEHLSNYQNSDMGEPNLIKYEKKFGDWINWKGTDLELRTVIMDTVLNAEKPLEITDTNFWIMPNDLAHLISDLFNSDIDVIFDIACKIIREKSEDRYYKLITILSNLIIDLHSQNKSIQPIAIVMLLVIIEESINIHNYSMKYENPKSLIEYIKRRGYILVDTYYNDEREFSFQLELYLKKLIQQFNSQSQDIKIPLGLDEYIVSIKDKK